MGSSRALRIMGKHPTERLFQIVVAAVHSFVFNQMRETPFSFSQLCSTYSSDVLDGKTIFSDTFVAKEKIYETLFQETEFFNATVFRNNVLLLLSNG